LPFFIKKLYELFGVFFIHVTSRIIYVCLMGRAEQNYDGQRLPSFCKLGTESASGGFAPQARPRRLSGSAARPFAPPSHCCFLAPHIMVRLIARALGFIYRYRRRKRGVHRRRLPIRWSEMSEALTPSFFSTKSHLLRCFFKSFFQMAQW